MKTVDHGVEFVLTDGIYIRQIVLPNAGTVVPQHAHVWDHTTMLARGSVRAWKDGKCIGEFVAPCPIFIEKGAKHAFLTLEDDVLLYCLHNLHGDEAVGVLAEHELTPAEAETLLRTG